MDRPTRNKTFTNKYNQKKINIVIDIIKKRRKSQKKFNFNFKSKKSDFINFKSKTQSFINDFIDNILLKYTFFDKKKIFKILIKSANYTINTNII